MIRITEDEKMSSNKKLKDNSNKLQLAKKYLSMALKILEEQDEDNALFYSLRHSGKIESITENDRNRINNELRRLYTLKPLK